MTRLPPCLTWRLGRGRMMAVAMRAMVEIMAMTLILALKAMAVKALVM